MIEPQAPKLPDEYYAKQIRETIKALSEVVNQAKKAGLDVNLKLTELGNPAWIGYQDAAIIIRKY